MNLNGLKDKLLSTIGQAGDSAKDFAEKAADATKDFAGKAADKAKAGTRIAKLSVEIAQEKENMKKAYVEIGKLYYDTHKDAPEGFFIQLCEEITLAQKAVADKEAEIAALKSNGAEGEPDITVEFEEVVSEAEAAAEPAEAEAAEIFDEAAEAIEDVVSEAEADAEDAKDEE